MTRKAFTKILRGAISLLRPHHWIKNIFVLVPAFFGGLAVNAPVMSRVVSATVVFCLLSSIIYIINDIRDIEADRQHTKKNQRPLAAGIISKHLATTIMVFLAAAVGLLLWQLHPDRDFLAIVCVYVGLNFLYSFGLKQLTLIEVFLVSSGYILRLIAGATIAQEHLTNWIIACTGMVSLLLTVGKRRGDMAQNNDGKPRQALKRYSITYLDHIMTMLAAATIVTYLLFTMSDYAQVRFGAYIMASTVFVVFGIMRYLQIVMVESGGDQPTALFYRDPWMVGTVAGYAIYFLATIYLT